MLIVLSRHKWPLLFSAIAIVYPAICLALGDVIPVRDGLGYDGFAWAVRARGVWRGVLEEDIDAYSFQKSLSWFILGGAYWVISTLFPAFHDVLRDGFNLTIAIVSFWVLNSVCLTATAFLWNGVLDELKVREPVALLSYFLLFISVGNLRMPAFYVTISDVQMVLVGAAALYLFLKSRQWSLLPVGFLSGFVRSGLPEAIALLVLFPRRHGVTAHDHNRGWFGVVMGLLAAIAIVAIYFWQINSMRGGWLALSILCAYAGTALYFLLRDLPFAALRPQLADALKALLVVLSVAAVLKLVTASSGSISLEYFVHGIVITGTWFPGVSFVALVVYYGPGFLLVFLLFPRLTKAANTFGPGMIGFLSLGVGISLFSESRVAAVYVPAFLAMVALVLSDMHHLTRWGYYVTAGLCVLFSKIWLPMRWSDSYSTQPSANFPEQLYFMNFGPDMTIQTFVLQAAGCIVAMLVLACWLYESRIAQFATSLRPGKYARRPGGP
jgi:hypothetical protein